jgi:hypothetical protein
MERRRHRQVLAAVAGAAVAASTAVTLVVSVGFASARLRKAGRTREKAV